MHIVSIIFAEKRIRLKFSSSASSFLTIAPSLPLGTRGSMASFAARTLALLLLALSLIPGKTKPYPLLK
jgi:hypothetical protein